MEWPQSRCLDQGHVLKTELKGTGVQQAPDTLELGKRLTLEMHSWHLSSYVLCLKPKTM